MFDLVVEDHHTDRDILIHLLKELKAMALDLTTLTAALTANSASLANVSAGVDRLIALHTDPAAQAAVDTAATQLQSNTAVLQGVEQKIDAVAPPPPPVAAPELPNPA